MPAPLVVLDMNAWLDYFRIEGSVTSHDDPVRAEARARLRLAVARGLVRPMLTIGVASELAGAMVHMGHATYCEMMLFAWEVSGGRLLTHEDDRCRQEILWGPRWRGLVRDAIARASEFQDGGERHLSRWLERGQGSGTSRPPLLHVYRWKSELGSRQPRYAGLSHSRRTQDVVPIRKRLRVVQGWLGAAPSATPTATFTARSDSRDPTRSPHCESCVRVRRSSPLRGRSRRRHRAGAQRPPPTASRKSGGASCARGKAAP